MVYGLLFFFSAVDTMLDVVPTPCFVPFFPFKAGKVSTNLLILLWNLFEDLVCITGEETLALF